MKKLLIIALSVMFLLSSGFVAACEDGDYKCKPVEQTLVKGEVTYADSGDEAGRAIVEVTCYHDGCRIFKNN